MGLDKIQMLLGTYWILGAPEQIVRFGFQVD